MPCSLSVIVFGAVLNLL